MKRLLSLLLITIILLSFTSCTKKEPIAKETTTIPNTTTTTSNEETTTTNELKEATIKEEKDTTTVSKEETTKATKGTTNTTKKNTVTTTKSTNTTTQIYGTPVRDYDLAKDFLNKLNAYRKSKGLCELKMEPFMQEYAMTRANDLIKDFSHNGNSYSKAIANCPMVTDSYGERLPKYSYTGENIVRGAAPPQDIVTDALDAFKNSSGHEANQTNPNWTHVGVGAVKVVHGANWVDFYISVNFYQENDFSWYNQ